MRGDWARCPAWSPRKPSRSRAIAWPAQRRRRVSRPRLRLPAAAALARLSHRAQFHPGRERRRTPCGGGAALPGDELLAIEYLDARGKDGNARKYRVMMIDGRLYPLHLAISAELEGALFHLRHGRQAGPSPRGRRLPRRHAGGARRQGGHGARRRSASALGLDYAGIDFGLERGGNLLLFEANATMVIAPPSPRRALGLPPRRRSAPSSRPSSP